MGRKKKATGQDRKSTGGEHKTPRVNMQVPEAWMKLARLLGNQAKQPTLWYWLQILADAADRAGVERPPLPWEEPDDK